MVIIAVSLLVETVVVLDDKLELGWLHRLRQALSDAGNAALLEGLFAVVCSNSDNHNFRQRGAFFPDASLLCKDALRGLEAIHSWHVDVRQDDAVVNVTAGLLHVFQVHHQHLLAIIGLVTLESVVMVKDLLYGNQVEHQIVCQQDGRFAATAILRSFRVKVGV